MRGTMVVAGLLVALAAAVRPVSGQVYLSPELAWHDDADFGVGAGVDVDTPGIVPGLSLGADFLVFFPDGYDYLELGINATYEIEVEDSPVTPFVLGGLAIGWSSFDVPDGMGGAESESETELGLNLGGGVAFEAGDLRPRVGLRLVVSDNTAFVIFASVPFRVAGAGEN